MDKDGGGSLTEDEFIKVCIKITLDIELDTLTITLYSRRFKTYNLFPAGAFISVDNFEPTGSFGK